MDDYCNLCNRNFVSERALEQHLRSARVHRFDCLRCRKHFKSAKAENQHYDNSPYHHICERCNLDFFNADGLEDHCVEEHNMCRDCGRRFSSRSNLDHHRQVHMDAEVDCPGCDLHFISTAAVVLHLEAGTCRSGADRLTVNRAAHSSGLVGHYFDMNGRSSRFRCPDCRKLFRFMSGLLQHDFSGRCPNARGYPYLRSIIEDFEDELGREISQTSTVFPRCSSDSDSSWDY